MSDKGETVALFLHTTLLDLGLSVGGDNARPSRRWAVHAGLRQDERERVFRVAPAGEHVHLQALILGGRTVLPRAVVPAADTDVLLERCRAVARAFREYAPEAASKKRETIKSQVTSLLAELDVATERAVLEELLQDNAKEAAASTAA